LTNTEGTPAQVSDFLVSEHFCEFSAVFEQDLLKTEGTTDRFVVEIDQREAGAQPVVVLLQAPVSHLVEA
jgi:hypothetical protein